MCPDPVPSREAVEAAARALYAAKRKAAPWEALAEYLREEVREDARAVLDAVDLVPREELERERDRVDALLDQLAFEEHRADEAEAQARAYREAATRVIELRGGEPGSYRREQFARALDNLEAALSPAPGDEESEERCPTCDGAKLSPQYRCPACRSGTCTYHATTEMLCPDPFHSGAGDEPTKGESRG